MKRIAKAGAAARRPAVWTTTRTARPASAVIRIEAARCRRRWRQGSPGLRTGFAVTGSARRPLCGQCTVMDTPAAAETVLDLTGLLCPLPLLKTKQAMAKMESGERIRILATDRSVVVDFRVFIDRFGHELLEFTESSGGHYVFVLRKA